jgi:hypothetical protein
MALGGRQPRGVLDAHAGAEHARLPPRPRRASTTLISRISGGDGPAADGASTHSAISGNGRQIVFTAAAWNLSPGRCNSAPAACSCATSRRTTRLVSLGDGSNRRLGLTEGSTSGEHALVTMLCA